MSVSKVGKFALKVTAIPEQHMIEKFSTHAFGQHAVDDVLANVDAERVRDDARNPWADESWIPQPGAYAVEVKRRGSGTAWMPPR